MKKPLFILYFCLMVVMIGFGITLPVLPFFIEQQAFTEGVTTGAASMHVGLLTGIFALMQFFFSPIWGRLSDRYGRRPIFLIGLAGYAFSLLLFGLGRDLLLLYGARILGGILSAAVFPTAITYVADLTTEKERGRGMAWLGSATGLGVVIGPALGALLSGLGGHFTFLSVHIYLNSFSIPFFGAALLSFLTLWGAIHWLPESSRPTQLIKTRHLSWRDILPLPAITGGGLAALLTLAFLTQFALAIFEGTFALHAQELAAFGTTQMGIVFVICGSVMALAQIAIVGWLIDRIGEKALLPVGFALTGAGLGLLMMTEQLEFILIYVAIFALGIAVLTPSLASLVSKRSGKQFGTTMGYLNAAISLGQASGPVLGGILFVWQFHAPYLITVAFLIAATIYITWKLLKKPLNENHPVP